jgi:putative tryptophan/tyrosine transport system substrate-binding protein
MALWRLCAATDARDRLSQRRVLGVRQHPRASYRVPTGPERNGLFRGRECGDRISLGGGPLRSADGPRSRSGSPSGGSDRRVAAAPTAFAAKAATTTIPIVFNQGLDPVQSGLVASLNRPGGNITGVTILATELAGKRLDLLHQLLPSAADVALLFNPANPVSASEAKSLEAAARVLGLRAHALEARIPSDIDAAFETLLSHQVAALVVAADPLFTNDRTHIIALAARHAVPAIYAYRLFPAAGGLVSYGADLADSYRQAGIYAGKILRGAKPADLPVQQAVKIELIINLKTANALGLTIPSHLLARADEVIE